MATFTYEPLQCQDGSLNQMRFELGDTVVEESGLPAILSDEEYHAILNAHKGNWKKAKLICLEAIMMKLSYEVDTTVDGLSYNYNQRAERWRAMYDELKKELKISSTKVHIPKAMTGSTYFHKDMHRNPRKW